MKSINLEIMYTLLLIFFIFSENLKAEESVLWSCSGMGMTPIQDSANLIEFRSGKAFFKEGVNGKAILICPITSVTKNLRNKTLGKILLVAKDEGPLPPIDRANSVRVELREVHKNNGHVQTIEGSKARTRIGQTGWKTIVTPFSADQEDTLDYKFNFEDKFYYIQVTLIRTKSGPLGVMGVQMLSK